jgi:folate-binding protein YgfZ
MPDEQLISNQINTLRKVGGYAVLQNFGVIEVAGIDAAEFLQARTTNDVLSLKPGDGQVTALLDRKAHVVAYFSLHYLDDKFFMLAERNQLPAIIAELEKYHFTEKVTFSKRADSTFYFAGVKSAALIVQASGQTKLPVSEPYSCARVAFFSVGSILIARSITGGEGYFVIAPTSDKDNLAGKAQDLASKLGMTELSAKALNCARIEAGVLEYGKDVDDKYLLPETGLDESVVSYTKGCYLGQEVIARVKGQGAPRRGLVGLIFAKDNPSSEPLRLLLNAKIKIAGNEIGEIKSSCFSPTLDRTIAMAYVSREYRVPGRTLSLQLDLNKGEEECQAEVVQLPFMQAEVKGETAQKLYEEALAEFALDHEVRAIELLREVLLLDAGFADAYEALGVILNREGEVDEAIELMKKLAEIDPKSVMAHSNLSLYYANKGLKKEAEDEKALAMAIRMQSLSDQMTLEKQQEEEKIRLIEAARERMKMFSQVLEIDAEDHLANYGAGSIHVELGEFAEALPYLQKALSLKPNHTVSYLFLGQAYEGLNQVAKAIEAYNKGMEVAAMRGEMQPSQEMQKRLLQLEAARGRA